MSVPQLILVNAFWLGVVGIVYTYAGYPLLLAMLARLRPPRRSPETVELPKVTLLIAAYNEEEVIANKLEESLILDYPAEKLQILVAADGSDDATPEIVRRYAGRGVDLCFSAPRQGKMAAISHAMTLATGDIVITSDANNRYDDQVIRKLVEPYADPLVGAVGGAKHIIQDGTGLSVSEGLYWKYESYIKQQESRLSSCVSMPGEVLSLRRELFEPPGGSVINDDAYITMEVLRRGYRVLYEPGAKSYEPVSATARDEFARRARMAAGRYEALRTLPVELFWKRPVVMWQWLSHKFMRLMLPVAMIAALLTNAILVIWPPDPTGTLDWLRLAPPSGGIALSLQGSFYLLAAVGNRLEKRGLIGRLLYVPSFLVTSNMAAAVGFYRYLSRSQAATWQRVARREV